MACPFLCLTAVVNLMSGGFPRASALVGSYMLDFDGAERFVFNQ
jgi:hypothetical protein